VAQHFDHLDFSSMGDAIRKFNTRVAQSPTVKKPSMQANVPQF
jgi:hypothetical protein